MPIEITQDEMNILNLNGISYDDIKDNIELSRASGLDDTTIREQFTNTIKELQPITKTSFNTTGEIKNWQEKGAIGPYEYAQRKAYLYDGTYSNIDNKANLSKVEQVFSNSSYNDTVEQRIEKQKQAKLERDKRVNEGTASFIDRVGAAVDRWGKASLEAQKSTPSLEAQVQQDLTSLENNKKEGKIGFAEAAANSYLSGEWTPFIGGFIGGIDDKKEHEIQEKIIAGKPIRQDELDFLNNRQKSRQEEAVRGYTIGGEIGNSLLPSMIRFSTELGATSWFLKGLGGITGIHLPTLAKNATFTQQALHHGRNMLIGGTVNTISPLAWNETFANLQQRLLQNGMQFTDKGEVLFQEAKEKPAISFLKSMGETFVMFASEHSGALLGLPVKGVNAAVTKYVGTPVSNYLKSNAKITKFIDKIMPELSKLYEKANKLKPQGKNFEFLKDMTKFDGFVEELGEEVVEDLLNLTLGTQDQERTLENYAKAVFKSPDEWAVLAGAIALQGGLLSVGSHVLGGYMERNGATDDEIVQTLNNLSESEIRKEISKITNDGTLDVSSYENKEQQAIENLKENYFNQLKAAGADDVVANQTASLYALGFAKLAKDSGKSINEIAETNISFKNLTEDEAVKQYNQGFNQVPQDVEPKFQAAASAGANENEIAIAEKEYAEKGTESKYFKKWTDDAPVVTAEEAKNYNFKDGEKIALQLFHGTRSKIEIFDKSKAGQSGKIAKVGFWFTDRNNFAENFANNIWWGEEQEAITMPVYVSMKKPKVYKKRNVSEQELQQAEKKVEEIENKIKDLKKQYNQTVMETGSFAQASKYTEQAEQLRKSDLKQAKAEYAELRYVDPYELLRTDIYKIEGKNAEEANLGGIGTSLDNQDETIEKFVQTLKEQGYDGIIIQETTFDSEEAEANTNNQYVAFNPEQIKSVDNRGTFDANNPNIYFQGGNLEFEVDGSFDLNKYIKSLNVKKNIKKSSENFAEKLELILDDKLASGVEPIVLFKPTKILTRVGIPDAKIVFKQGKIKKVLNEHLTIEDLKKIPELLANPEYIFESATDENGFVVVLTREERPLIVAITKVGKEFKIKNIIKSAYNKGVNFVSDNIKEGRLLYDKSNPTRFRQHRASIAQAKTLSDNNIITDSESDFKSGDTYYQGLDEDSNVSDTEKSIRNAKGFFYEKKAFDGTPKENIVVLIKNKADASTLVHEFAHIYLQTLNNLARTSDKAKQQLLTVNKWLRYDGKEYTTAQHEKFADGFVAYVKSGKAPTYGLKRVFENFRRWLSDISNKIFTTEDIEIDPDVKKVFDELLGDLSVNQQEKLSEELITKARDNAALRMRDELVEKGKVKFNELTEKQRRYRDTAYDIIFYALKHSKDEETRNYVQNISDLRMKLGSGNTKSLQRQFERIELLLAETDDAFSAHDGFLPEWGEFFNDTGVSYDNLQQGADAELALNAFEVIRDKKYLYDETFEELSENDVKKAQYELDYIINEYKYAEDKSIPMSAFFTWIDSQHPYIQDELLKQWENETNEIDRYQALSKFEQAKEDLKIKAMQMQGLGDYSMQFAEYARAIVKRLDFMTEKDKARIFDKLKDFNSFKEVLANLDDVMDFAQTLYNVTERRKIADDIIKEVKGTIHEWKDGIKRTKYTYPANNLFTRLRELNKLPLEDIKDLYDAQVNEEIKPTYEADAVNTDDYYETIEKMFIEFKANGVYYNSTEFLQDLLTRIQNAKFTAKIARDEMDFERRMQAINLVDEAAKAVDKHKGKVSKLEQAYRYGFNLNSALEMMFDKNIKSKFTLDYLYAQKDAKVGADRDAVLEKLKKNFGFKGPIADTLLFNKFIDMTKKGEFKITQRYSPDIAQGVIRETHRDKETGKVFTDKKINYAKDAARSEWEPEEIELSRMEVLYYYIQSLNEESYKILTDMGDETTPPKGQFDKYEFDEMINQLTDQEKMMGLILQQAAEKYYDELNRYHIKKYHTELGKVNMYFPRKTELTEVKPLELFSDYANYSGVLSAQKQRTANAGARIAPANALAVLFQHMEKANTLIVMGEQLDLMNRVFKDQSLKKKVEIVWGIDTAKEFYNQIAGNLYSGQASMLSEAENLIGRIENNVIKAQIFAKAQVGLKQIISFMNYGTGDEHVSTAEWNAAFWKQSFTPQEWKNNIDYMMNIPYLKDRFGRGGSTDALKRQLEQRMFAKMSLLDEFFSLPIKIGDMGAIILGGKPYIDALMNKGYTEEQAIKIFIEKTVNEMQSSIPSTLSNLQRNAAKQPLAKMLFAYQNTPWQYFRVASNAIIRWKQNPNKDTTLNMVKLVGLYMYIFPLIFNLASSLSLITGDEDELKNDIWKSIIGGVTFIPLAGQFINAMLSGVLGERVSTGNWFDTAAAKTGNIARKISKGDDVTAVDVLKALALFGEAGTGLPLTTLGTEVAGVGDIATGSPAKGIMKVAGYSDYRAKKITGEED